MNYKLKEQYINEGVRQASCKECHQKYEVYESLGSYNLPGLLICQQCKNLFLYDKESDLLKDIGLKSLPQKSREDNIESLLSPCKICGGKLKHHDILRWFPDDCPKCGATDKIVDTKSKLETKKVKFTWIVFD